MQLFPLRKSLHFIAMDIVGPFLKTSQGNQCFFVVTDRCFKLTQTIPTPETTTTYVLSLFKFYWLIPFGIPSYSLTDYGTQFVSYFFTIMCALFGVKHYNLTMYHPQKNGQAERFDKTIFTRLEHYVAEHQKNWGTLVQPLTYTNGTQVYRSAKHTPFNLVFCRHIPGPSLSKPSIASSTDGYAKTSTQVLRSKLEKRLRILQAKDDAAIASA